VQTRWLDRQMLESRSVCLWMAGGSGMGNCCFSSSQRLGKQLGRAEGMERRGSKETGEG